MVRPNVGAGLGRDHQPLDLIAMARVQQQVRTPAGARASLGDENFELLGIYSMQSRSRVDVCHNAIYSNSSEPKSDPMLDPTTIVLILLAGLLHASWHSLVRYGADQIAVLTGMGLFAGAAAACAIPFLPVPGGPVWIVIGISVALHVGYKFALARSYMLGELGYAYPLGRGFVPLVSTAIAFVLLGEKPGAVQVLGIAVVCAGLVILAMASIRGHFDRRLIPPAFATGLTVAAYSALDAYGTRLDGNWLAYTCWLIAVDATSFALLITWMKGPRFWRELPRDSTRIVVSGAFGLLSFLVLLWALSRSPVGAVSALRECSVVFATIIGMAIHGERRSFLKISAAGLIAAGLILTAAARL